MYAFELWSFLWFTFFGVKFMVLNNDFVCPVELTSYDWVKPDVLKFKEDEAENILCQVESEGTLG